MQSRLRCIDIPGRGFILFSSRRRHTRFDCDWSSDVCSSDLGVARPEGLLHFENNIIFRLFPLHIGMRWYWKDFDSMERWTRSEPHRTWWQNFIRDSGGTGFWHEAYFMRGGMEGVYVDVNRPPLGFQAFARDVPMRGRSEEHTSELQSQSN